MNIKPKTFYSRGKLLLTGEYVVLDGALSLAIPTRFGQDLTVEEIKTPKLTWKGLDETGKTWFEDSLSQADIASGFSKPRNDISNRLLQILQAASLLNPEFLNENNGYKITTTLEFPKNWGLGTSSTLINNIANWAQVDAYKLLETTFGGSGYDIACAQYNSAITYQIQKQDQNSKRRINQISFNPIFKDQLYFVYLNEKQNSRDGIAQYKKNNSNLTESISEISAITHQIISCSTLNDFNLLIDKHEAIISKIINQTPVKQRLFSDFNGSIKSLGAWGGDFVLAASKENPTSYFKSKGFDTVLSFDEMLIPIIN